MKRDWNIIREIILNIEDGIGITDSQMPHLVLCQQAGFVLPVERESGAYRQTLTESGRALAALIA